MTKEYTIYSMPNVGCLLGTANQVLLTSLSESLNDAHLDITSSEYLVLRALYDHDGMQQCEIASLLGRDQAAVCRCVKQMAAKQLIYTRTVSRKCLRVFVAEKGRRIESAVKAVGQLKHKQLSEMLTSGELEMLVKILNKIIMNDKNK